MSDFKGGIMRLKFFFGLVSVCFATYFFLVERGFAEESVSDSTNETRVELDKVKDAKDKNKTEGVDTDQVVTNRLMRTQSGSKSKWSLNAALNYQGSTVERPLAAGRPNITGGVDVNAKAALSGTVDVKYGLNSLQSLRAGTGIRWVTPLEKQLPKDYRGDRIDADNPYLQYQHLLRWSGIQTNAQVAASWITQENLRALGYQSNLEVSFNNAYEVGKTGLTFGLLTIVGYSTFDKTSAPSRAPSGQTINESLLSNQSEFELKVYPFAEYVLNKTFNIRTVSWLFSYEHTRADGAWTFKRTTVGQSVGLGIAPFRDVYLYPNVQFVPSDLRADRTNVGLTAYLNVF